MSYPAGLPSLMWPVSRNHQQWADICIVITAHSYHREASVCVCICSCVGVCALERLLAHRFKLRINTEGTGLLGSVLAGQNSLSWDFTAHMSLLLCYAIPFNYNVFCVTSWHCCCALYYTSQCPHTKIHLCANKIQCSLRLMAHVALSIHGALYLLLKE